MKSALKAHKGTLLLINAYLSDKDPDAAYHKIKTLPGCPERTALLIRVLPLFVQQTLHGNFHKIYEIAKELSGDHGQEPVIEELVFLYINSGMVLRALQIVAFRNRKITLSEYGRSITKIYESHEMKLVINALKDMPNSIQKQEIITSIIDQLKKIFFEELHSGLNYHFDRALAAALLISDVKEKKTCLQTLIDEIIKEEYRFDENVACARVAISALENEQEWIRALQKWLEYLPEDFKRKEIQNRIPGGEKGVTVLNVALIAALKKRNNKLAEEIAGYINAVGNPKKHP